MAFPLNLIEFLKKVGKGETLLSFKFKGSITTTQYLRGGDILTYLHVYVAIQEEGNVLKLIVLT